MTRTPDQVKRDRDNSAFRRMVERQRARPSDRTKGMRDLSGVGCRKRAPISNAGNVTRG